MRRDVHQNATRFRHFGPVACRRIRGVLGALSLVAASTIHGVTNAAPPAYDHVVIVVEENHTLQQVIGSAEAPYINQLASEGVSFSNMYGITHPSHPNYMHLFSGHNQGITGDRMPAELPLTAPNLGAALMQAGKSFVGYSEDLPAAGSLVEFAGEYVRRHSPWTHWQDDSVERSPFALPPASNQPFTSFPTDPAKFSELPTVSFVIPNQEHNMHDGSISAADEWLRTQMGAYNDWAKQNNSLLIIAWDEDDFYETNQIPLIFSGAHLQPGTLDGLYTHHNLLRTIEDMYGVTHSGLAAKSYPIYGAFAGETPRPLMSLAWQQGHDGYTSTVDTEIRQYRPEYNYDQQALHYVDQDNLEDPGLQASQALLRFDDVIGFGPGQIPPGATIESARVLITTANNGSRDTIKLQRMLWPWTNKSTWSTLDDGVTADDIEAVSDADFWTEPNVSDTFALFAVTKTLQAWANGAPNLGWFLSSSGTDAWNWYSSESEFANLRPRLEVEYSTKGLRGDLNEDGRIDATDVDQLADQLQTNRYTKLADINNDDQLDARDLEAWIHDARWTFYGDANLDQEFNTADLVSVFTQGEYEDGVPHNSTWSDGDWDADGDFGTHDLVMAFQDGAFESGPRASFGVSVPEPASSLSILSAALMFGSQPMRRRANRTQSAQC